MKPDTDLEDPKYWFDRAEETRAQAAQLKDPDARHIMLGVAQGYEQIGRRAASEPARTEPSAKR